METVLVVEDDPHSAELLTVYLEGAGYRIALARDGAEGLELARRLRPRAVVLDILLPRVDGWDLLARLKADPATADSPVVVVSMLDERGKGLALGAVEYLVKPVGREELLEALERCAEESRERDGARRRGQRAQPQAGARRARPRRLPRARGRRRRARHRARARARRPT